MLAEKEGRKTEVSIKKVGNEERGEELVEESRIQGEGARTGAGRVTRGR